MQETFRLTLDESALTPLAHLLAIELAPRDVVALSGDLGAGKSTLARAVIRAALDDPAADVPSPTFSLVQAYDTPRVRIAHFDLYRLSGAGDLDETGLDEAIHLGAVLVEWPERAAGSLPAERLDIALAETDDGSRRTLTLTGHGAWAPRIARLAAIHRFTAAAGWGDAPARPIPGDASSRRYLRLSRGNQRALLMDAPRQPDGPPIRDDKPYSRIAHLAEDVRPFVAIAGYLRDTGLSAPGIIAADLDAGLLLIEDLGDGVYGAELQRGAGQRQLWSTAVDALVALRRAPVRDRLNVAPGLTHSIARYDRDAMEIEIELLLDWYVPALTGAPASDHDRATFTAAWSAIIDRLTTEPGMLMLRDYHSPNLIALPDRTGAAGVGIIDFQDAMLGPAAYDLVSLLQDARLDVPADLEQDLLARYLDAVAVTEPDVDRARFVFAYAALGAQRNTKILGIFARLARRDHKPRYLQHIPRIWRYLERDLAHAELAPLREWYDRVLPAPLRYRVIAA